MSTGLQILLIVASIWMYVYVIRRIRQANIRIEDMVVWLLSSTGLLVISVFPIIPMRLAGWLGFMSASNFIFTAIICCLLLGAFGQSLRISHQKEQIKTLAQEIALMRQQVKQDR